MIARFDGCFCLSGLGCLETGLHNISHDRTVQWLTGCMNIVYAKIDNGSIDSYLASRKQLTTIRHPVLIPGKNRGRISNNRKEDRIQERNESYTIQNPWHQREKKTRQRESKQPRILSARYTRLPVTISIQTTPPDSRTFLVRIHHQHLPMPEFECSKSQLKRWDMRPEQKTALAAKQTVSYRKQILSKPQPEPNYCNCIRVPSSSDALRWHSGTGLHSHVVRDVVRVGIKPCRHAVHHKRTEALGLRDRAILVRQQEGLEVDNLLA